MRGNIYRFLNFTTPDTLQTSLKVHVRNETQSSLPVASPFCENMSNKWCLFHLLDCNRLPFSGHIKFFPESVTYRRYHSPQNSELDVFPGRNKFLSVSHTHCSAVNDFIYPYFVLTISWIFPSLPVFLLGLKFANMWASELLSTMLVTRCAAGLGWNTRPHWPVILLGWAAHSLLVINNIRIHNKAQQTLSSNFVIHKYSKYNPHTRGRSMHVLCKGKWSSLWLISPWMLLILPYTSIPKSQARCGINSVKSKIWTKQKYLDLSILRSASVKNKDYLFAPTNLYISLNYVLINEITQ